MLNEKDWELTNHVNCPKCVDRSMCDQVKHDCPRIDFKNGVIDEHYQADKDQPAITPEQARAILEDLRLMQEKSDENLPPFPCPRCGREITKPKTAQNALSRWADVYICDECGMDEAVRAAVGDPALPLIEWEIVKGFGRQRGLR